MDFKQALHQNALRASEKYLSSERELFACLVEVDKHRVYLLFGATSLFDYGTRVLKLSEAVTYNFVSVVKKSREVPELKQEVLSGGLAVSKARKLVSVVTKDNQIALIEFAKQATYRDLDRKIAELNPKPAVANLKSSGKEQETLHLTMNSKTAEKFRRMQDLLSTKSRRAVGLNECLEQVLDLALEKLDPIAKARRALARKQVSPDAERPKTRRATSESTTKVKKPPSDVVHKVMLHDQAQCTHMHSTGERCSNRRWLEIHHKESRVFGGDHHPENLRLLCSVHHRQIHRGP
jgi:5-methylcytosine-specific restriction endonuclease McrA